MKFSIAIQDTGVRDLLRSMHKQAPFAAILALNYTGQIMKKDLITEMKKVFKNPTPYTLNSLQLSPAKKKNPEAEIWFRGKWIRENRDHYLWPHVYGIMRDQKPFEKALYRTGYLTSGRGKYVVPGQGARIDKYGNQSRGQIVQVLTALRALRGVPADVFGKPYKYKLRKGTKDYFVAKKGHLTPGVYQRQGKQVKPIMIFVKRAVYRKRFDFFGVAKKAYDQHYRNEFNRAFEQAVATSHFKGKWK